MRFPTTFPLFLAALAATTSLSAPPAGHAQQTPSAHTAGHSVAASGEIDTAILQEPVRLRNQWQNHLFIGLFSPSDLKVATVNEWDATGWWVLRPVPGTEYVRLWNPRVQGFLHTETLPPVTGSTRAVELGGHMIPAGSLVTVLIASAHRDPREFVDPERFAVGRRPGAHLAFGIGPHFCLGAYFGRLQARIVLDALLGPGPSLACHRVAGRYRDGEFRSSEGAPATTTLLAAKDRDDAVRSLPCLNDRSGPLLPHPCFLRCRPQPC
jgi:hypothetical protein